MGTPTAILALSRCNASAGRLQRDGRRTAATMYRDSAGAAPAAVMVATVPAVAAVETVATVSTVSTMAV